MTTKEELLGLLNAWDSNKINVDMWEFEFLESFEPHINTAPELLPNLSEKQEEVIERMYSKYIEGE